MKGLFLEIRLKTFEIQNDFVHLQHCINTLDHK